MALGDPAECCLAVMWRHIDDAAARADRQFRRVLADQLDREGDLPLGPTLEIGDEGVAYGRGIESRRAEAVEIDIACLQGQQLALPGVGDRAFPGQKRPRAELERDRPELGIVEPILPLLEAPDAARHEDRRAVEPE